MACFKACFGCGGTEGFTPAGQKPGKRKGLVQADEKAPELTRNELRKLFDKCMQLNGGRLIVHGIFARANTKNNNRRIYPKHILKREVAKFEEEHIWAGTALGELDHPNYSSRYFKCLNLPNISHQVLEVHWDGDQLLGTIEILRTPSGLLLWGLYSQGIKLGVSSRGWASLRTDPRTRSVFVDDDFELITFDFVTEPSTHGAFLVPITYTYQGHLPDQQKAVQVAHLGHGVVSMSNITHVPDVPALVHRISQLQAQELAPQQQMTHVLTAPAAAVQAPADSSTQGSGILPHAHVLDQLLLYSHYMVLPNCGYLDREQHARDYQSHLAMFATRAHLADQAQKMSRADLNAIILREVTREVKQQDATAVTVGPFTMAQPGPVMQPAAIAAPMMMGFMMTQGQQGMPAQVTPFSKVMPSATSAGQQRHRAGPDTLDVTATSVGAGWSSAPGESSIFTGSMERKHQQLCAPLQPAAEAGALGLFAKPAKPGSEQWTDPCSDGDVLAAWTLHPHACPPCLGSDAYQEGRQGCSSSTRNSNSSSEAQSDGSSSTHRSGGQLWGSTTLSSSTHMSVLSNNSGRVAQPAALDLFTQQAYAAASTTPSQCMQEESRMEPWEQAMRAAEILQPPVHASLAAAPPAARTLLMERAKASGRSGPAPLEDEPVLAMLPHVKPISSSALQLDRKEQGKLLQAGTPVGLMQGGDGCAGQQPGDSCAVKGRPALQAAAWPQPREGAWQMQVQRRANLASIAAGGSPSNSPGLHAQGWCRTQPHTPTGSMMVQGNMPGQHSNSAPPSTCPAEIVTDPEIEAEFIRVRATLAALAVQLQSHRQAVQAAYSLNLAASPVAAARVAA